MEGPETFLPQDAEDLWDAEEKPRIEGAGGSPAGGMTTEGR